jgi:UDPglucose--hexose-1-phosphate uridylyltransferase
MVTKEWVIIATERAKRPSSYAEVQHPDMTATQLAHDPTCPFCPGNEEIDLEVGRTPTHGPWQTRVVQNKYPALARGGELQRAFEGVYRYISGVGHHEVVVDHPRHNTTLALMDVDEIKLILTTFYERGWSICRDSRIEHIVYFKNHGQQAGASLVHPHSQIIGLPVVPTNIRHRTEEARRYFDDNGQCVFCAMIQEELTDGSRLVLVSEHFVAFTLYAAPTPFHLWVVPRQHSVSFVYSLPEQLEDLAYILQNVLHRMYVGLHDPAYNLIIRSSPVKELSNEYLHWYATIVPRLSHTAGFELGSGVFINPSLPEECADFLRKVET